MNKKQIAVLILGTLVLGVMGITLYLGPHITLDLSGEGDKAFLFYRDLGIQFKDCGNEELEHGFGYNESMRKCFIKAYSDCRLAKIHQKLLTVEGDPIFTTAVVEGEAPKGCKAHIYVDSRDTYGKFGESDTICYSVILDSSSGQESLFFDSCEDGTQQFLY